MPQFEINIDERLCWGCRTCEVACKQENRAPDGIRLIAVAEIGPKAVDGQYEFSFEVNLCRHCDDPPCAEACPETAINKRDDGIVVMDYELCTGCQACIEACPEDAISKREDGIIVMDDERCSGCQACVEKCPYDAITFDEDKGIARKCNLCHHRVDRGLIPACADNVCLAHCINFGLRD